MVLMAMALSVITPIVLNGNVSAAVAAAPKNLRLVNDAGTHDCGLHTNINSITPTWNAAAQAISYNYMVTLPGGSVYGPVNVGNVTSVTGPFGAEGTSSFSVQSVYNDNSTSDWALPCEVTYDATKPVISTNITPGAVLKGIVPVTATVTEANPLLHSITVLDSNGNPVLVKGKKLVASESPVTANSLSYDWDTKLVADGAYKLQFIATDKAGNTETVLHDVTVDNTAPGATIDAYPTPISDTTPTISGTVDDNNTTVQVTIEGVIYTAVPSSGRWSITTNTLADGTYTISAVAIDAAGNATAPPASGSITIDTTAPSALLTSPVSGSRAHGLVQISGTVTDAVSYTLSINGDVVAAGVSGAVSYQWDTTGFISGTYRITLSATDAAGNTTQDTVLVAIDNTAPALPVRISPTNNATGTGGTINTLSWLASEDPSGPVQYSVQLAADPAFTSILNSGTVTTTAYGLMGLSDGTYFWRLQACDSFDNCSGWSDGWSFTIDNTAPVFTVDDSDTTDTTPTIKGTVNDPTAIVTIRVSGITYAAIVNTVPNVDGTYAWAADVTQKLSYGPHSITVFARDTLGNNAVQSGAITITATTAETNAAISRLAGGSSVLGNSAQAGVVSDAAATDTKDQTSASAKASNSAFLRLGWWWLPLLVVLLGSAYYGYVYKNPRG